MRKLPIAVAVAAVALVLPLAPAQASGHSRCYLAGAHVVARDSAAVVLVKGATQRFGGPPYYGCAFRKGRHFRLNRPDDQTDTGWSPIKRRLIRLAGHIALTVQTPSCGACESSTDEVVVTSLFSGRVVARAPQPLIIDDDAANEEVTDAVLRSDGHAAYIYAIEPFNGTPVQYGVHVVASHGDQLVSAGPDVDPTSLEISADHHSVTWTQGGQQRSASLD
jgi:hypothetical protein